MPRRTTLSRRLSGALAVAAITCAVVAAVPVAAAADAGDPARLVNPFIGTGSGGPVVGDVDAFPGATTPFGMVQWSPDTPGRPSGGGYRYDDHEITGFSLTHLSGVGCPTGGDFPFLPLTGALPADPGSASLPFTHADESAAPGRYSVTAGGIGVALATGVRTGVARLTYPPSAAAVAGGFVTFDTRTDPVVRVKVALSYVDVAGAEANLRAEARTFDVTAVADAARRSWDRMLGRVRVSGGTADERTQFYTALYH